MGKVEAEAGKGEIEEPDQFAGREFVRYQNIAKQPTPCPAITASIACSSSLNVNPFAATSSDTRASIRWAMTSQRCQVGACGFVSGHQAWTNGYPARSEGQRIALLPDSSFGLATGQNLSRSSSEVAKPGGGAKA